jgi:hypothetical protein
MKGSIIMKTIILALSLSLLYGTAFATPSVNSVSGTINNGSSITVSGSSFGSQGGSIVGWDNFDNKSSGADVAGTSPLIGNFAWSLQHTGGTVKYNNTHTHSGSLAANVNWTGSNGIEAFGFAGQGPFSQLYITYWRYMEGTYTPGTQNHKQWYLFGNGTYNGYSEMPQAMPLIPAGTSNWAFYNNTGIANDTLYGAYGSYTNTSSTWNRWEYFVKLNTVGSANGIVKMLVDGNTVVDRSNYQHRYAAGEWKDFRLGHMTNGFTSSAKAWFDDLYIATTQARVEIGNASTFSACTHREIQIPTLWNDGTISVTVNQGSFAASSSAYLFVVDSDGNVSSGKQITFGSGSSTSLASPQNFKLTSVVQ